MQGDELKDIVAKWNTRRGKKVSVLSKDVQWKKQGNFTVALVKKGKKVGVGVAKRLPSDPPSDIVGKAVSLFRALDDLTVTGKNSKK